MSNISQNIRLGLLQHKEPFISIYLPLLLIGTATYSSFLILPLAVLDAGGSTSQAAAVLGLKGLGMMLFDIPAGFLVSRIGSRAAMSIATFLLFILFLLYGLASSPTVYLSLALIHGFVSALFLVGRMLYISDKYDFNLRSRVIAMLAGGLRLTALIGPIIGGILAEAVGFQTTFLISSFFLFFGFYIVTTKINEQNRIEVKSDFFSSYIKVISKNKKIFLTAGVASVIFMLMRAARIVLIPIVGDSLGLSVTSIGFVVSLSAAIDLILFYPAGILMSRFGRRAGAIPSSILFSIGLMSLAFVQSYLALIFIAIILGVANGLSTGITMMLGTDNAPSKNKGEFLGVWRLLTDGGSSFGPILASFSLAIFPFNTGLFIVGIACSLGAVFVFFGIQQDLKQSEKSRKCLKTQ